MFRTHVLIVRMPKLYYTASGIITLKQVSVFFFKITKITKITKIQFYKYEHIVVKFMCEFFGCDYCVLLNYKHFINNNNNKYTIITPKKFTHTFYYYAFILIELYFSNFSYFSKFRKKNSLFSV